MNPNFLDYAKPDPPAPRRRDRLFWIGFGMWLVGWPVQSIGIALQHSHHDLATGAMIFGFDLVILAFFVTVLAGLLGQKRNVAALLALLQIILSCAAIRH